MPSEPRASVWSARSLLPLSERPRPITAPDLPISERLRPFHSGSKLHALHTLRDVQRARHAEALQAVESAYSADVMTSGLHYESRECSTGFDQRKQTESCRSRVNLSRGLRREP